MLSPQISFIILSYNKFYLLKKCINSIITFTQNLTYEIIVFDNNSTEGDPANILPKSDIIKIINSNKNYGWPGGINRAISFSSGEYICIVDNDVQFIENTAYKLLKFSQSLNNICIVGPSLINPDRSKQESIVAFPNFTNMFGEALLLNRMFRKNKLFNSRYQNYQKIESPIQVEMIITACAFFHRSVFNELNGFEDNFFLYAGDVDFCYRYNLLGGKVYYFPDSQVIHLGSIATQSTKFAGYNYLAIDTLKYYRKHYKMTKRSYLYFFDILSLINRSIIWNLIGIVTLNTKTIKKSFLLLTKLVYYCKGLMHNEKQY